MQDTIFDKIVRKEIPAEIIYEDDHVLAFKDISAQAPVHVLVIPRNKVTGFDDLADASVEEVGQLFKGAATVARNLNLVEDGGYRIVVNHGKRGQQSVPYLHIHILGGRDLTWPPG